MRKMPHIAPPDFYASLTLMAGLGHLMLQHLGALSGYVVASVLVFLGAVAKVYIHHRAAKTSENSN